MHVLIVDDDSSVREALLLLLSAADLHAVGFASAAEYIAHPKPEIPACLILDVNMPGRSGLETCREIRGDGAYS